MLARRLESVALHTVQASPVQRARETAEAIAATRPGIVVQIAEALDELDFGDWSGRAFAELEADPQWHTWNERRSAAVTPAGESMAQAQARAWQHIEQTADANPDRIVAMVTHCDIIRAVVAHALGLSLDAIHRFDVDPASVSRLVVGEWGAKLLSLNERGDE